MTDSPEPAICVACHRGDHDLCQDTLAGGCDCGGRDHVTADMVRGVLRQHRAELSVDPTRCPRCGRPGSHDHDVPGWRLPVEPLREALRVVLDREPTDEEVERASKSRGWSERPPVEPLRLIAEGIEAFRLTREYVGEDTLPEGEGWSWFDWCAKARASLRLSDTGERPYIAPPMQDWPDHADMSCDER